MIAMNLYAVRVGNTGSFFVAAIDMAQAKAIGESWKRERATPNQNVTVKRYSDQRPVYVPEHL